MIVNTRKKIPPGYPRYMAFSIAITLAILIMGWAGPAWAAPDTYDTPPENDDTPQAATPITIGMEQHCIIDPEADADILTQYLDCEEFFYPQEHNFHRDSDEDWVKFFAVQNGFYEINIFGRIGLPNLDMDGYQIDTGGNIRPIDVKKDHSIITDPNDPLIDPRDPDLRFTISVDVDGFIFLRIFPTALPTTDDGYWVSIDRNRDFAGLLKGQLLDATSGAPIAGGWIKSVFKEGSDEDQGASLVRSAISLRDGHYLIVHPAGNQIQLSAGAPGYREKNWPNTIAIAELANETFNFELERLPTGMGNFPPDRPIPTAPSHQDTIADLTVRLSVADFSDPDLSDIHDLSHWQVAADADFNDLVLEAFTNVNLTGLPILGPFLMPGNTYFWRIRFTDSSAFESPWSQAFALEMDADPTSDTNANGVPDSLEPGDTSDLDNNGVPDENQPELLRMKSAVDEKIVGLAITSGSGQLVQAAVLDEASLEGIDPVPDAAPFGVWTLRIVTDAPGETVSVSIYSTEGIPTDAKLYKHDPINGWHLYSGAVDMAADGKGVTISLTDGADGDGDGLENGIIVDPIGISFERTDPPSDNGSGGDGGTDVDRGGGSSGGGGGGCFVRMQMSLP